MAAEDQAERKRIAAEKRLVNLREGALKEFEKRKIQWRGLRSLDVELFIQSWISDKIEGTSTNNNF